MIPDEAGFGYDPTLPEPFDVTRPRFVDRLLSSAAVDPAFLPPVGQQGTAASPGYPGSCCAWASTYGLATFTAARAGRVSPESSSGQASPAYIYIQVLQQMNDQADSCTGSKFEYYFSILKNGTASMASAPYYAQCQTLWQDYASKTIAGNADFAIGQVKGVSTGDLDSVKQVLASGRALAYGTKLYTDWASYRGNPVPYVGTGTILKGKDGKPAGHCMLIIGYDDTIGGVHIQNSQGTGWGSAGYVWMAYATFQALAQGTALYVPD